MTAAKTTAHLKSFLRAEMKRARRQLQRAGHRHAAGPVHDARKTIKKLRAALRLAETMMTEPARIEAVAVPLREAAHRLGPLRDALVLGHTARKLRQRGEKPLPAPPAPTAGAAALLQEARAQLRRAEGGLRRLLQDNLDPDGLGNGLRLLYRSARRAMRRADDDPDDENLHAWRRRTKDFYYTLEVVGAPARDMNKVKRLTEFLGDDHDLALLARACASPAELEAHRPLFKRLRRKRRRLQKKAFQLGKRILAERPAKRAARLAAS
jgi:CHAD domain-containing protein